MFTHIPTGKQFENRLQAKLYFGSANYNRRAKNKEFTFHDGSEMLPKEVYESLKKKEK